MNKNIMFSDSINIVYENDTVELYNVIYNKDKGLYLRSEEDSFIKRLHIQESLLLAYYSESLFKKSVMKIKNITIESGSLAKGTPGFYIEGNLLTYNEEMAKKYSLDEELAEDQIKFKKRIKKEEQ